MDKEREREREITIDIMELKNIEKNSTLKIENCTFLVTIIPLN